MYIKQAIFLWWIMMVQTTRLQKLFKMTAHTYNHLCKNICTIIANGGVWDAADPRF